MKYTFNCYAWLLLPLLMISSVSLNAQNESSDITTGEKNELSTNLLDLVIAGTLNFNYERHFKNNQSLWLSLNLFDTYGYYDAGYIEDNSAFAFQASYLIYFSSDQAHHGFFFYPLAKYRFGDITTEDWYLFSEDILPSEQNYTYEIDGFALGFGLGYKWVFSNHFTLTINAQIARNLSDFKDDYLSNVEPRFAVNFGYRF